MKSEADVSLREIQESDKSQARGKETKGKSESWQKVTKSISVFRRRPARAVTQLFITFEECEVSLFPADASVPCTSISVFNGQTAAEQSRRGEITLSRMAAS